MTFINHAGAALVVVAFAIAGCEQGRDENPESETRDEQDTTGTPADTASVNESEFNYYVENRLRKPTDQVTEEEREQIRDELQKLELVAREAERRGIAKDPNVAARISLDRKSVLAQNLIQQHLAENPITDEELKAAYDEQAAQAPKNEYKARHMLLETEEAAREAIEKLNEGADFAELAEDNSTGPSAPTGGDLGWFTRDRMVKPFADAVAGMEPGTYTKEPVQTQFGWHVILLEEKRPATPPTFEEMQGQLRPMVEQKRVEQLVEELRESPAT
jgi:peptidyl-prolyl cis-trans isomerase C